MTPTLKMSKISPSSIFEKEKTPLADQSNSKFTLSKLESDELTPTPILRVTSTVINQYFNSETYKNAPLVFDFTKNKLYKKRMERRHKNLKEINNSI